MSLCVKEQQSENWWIWSAGQIKIPVELFESEKDQLTSSFSIFSPQLRFFSSPACWKKTKHRADEEWKVTMLSEFTFTYLTPRGQRHNQPHPADRKTLDEQFTCLMFNRQILNSDSVRVSRYLNGVLNRGRVVLLFALRLFSDSRFISWKSTLLLSDNAGRRQPAAVWSENEIWQNAWKHNMKLRDDETETVWPTGSFCFYRHWVTDS